MHSHCLYYLYHLLKHYVDPFIHVKNQHSLYASCILSLYLHTYTFKSHELFNSAEFLQPCATVSNIALIYEHFWNHGKELVKLKKRLSNHHTVVCLWGVCLFCLTPSLWGRPWERIKREHMVMKREWRGAANHMIQCTDDVLQNCTTETYIILLTTVIQINLI